MNKRAVLLCLIVGFFRGELRKIGTKHAVFDRFDGMCKGNDDVKIFLDYYGLKSIGRKLFMNSTITVIEEIIVPPVLKLAIKRCKSKENLDTCEDFHSFVSKQYCRLISSDSEMWNPFFGTIKPKWSCPIKKGNYTSINSSFDVTSFLLFPVDEYYWKVRAEMLDGETGKLIMCLIIEAKVMMSYNEN